MAATGNNFENVTVTVNLVLPNGVVKHDYVLNAKDATVDDEKRRIYVRENLILPPVEQCALVAYTHQRQEIILLDNSKMAHVFVTYRPIEVRMMERRYASEHVPRTQLQVLGITLK